MSQLNDPVADDGSSTSEHSSTDSYVSMTADQFEQNPDFRDDHYDRVTQIFSGNRSVESLRSLMKMGWTPQPEHVQRNWQVYVPEWTRPDWDPIRHVRLDGALARVAIRNERIAMRPAILPRDQDTSRTDYTL